MRKPRKIVAILATLAMLVTLLPLGAGVTFGATGYTSTVPNVDDNKWQQLGTVSAEIGAGLLENGHAVNLSLPTTDFKFYNDEKGAPVIKKIRFGNNDDKYQITVNDEVYAEIVVPRNYEGNDNALYDDALDVAGKPNRLDIDVLDTNEIQLKIAEDLTGLGSGNRAHFRLYLYKIYVEDGFSGDINLTAEKTTGTSGFPEGKILVGRVPGGICELACPELNTFTNSTTVRLRLKETVAGSLEKDTESLRFTLPSGFAWAQLEAKEVPAGYTDLAAAFPVAGQPAGYIYVKDLNGKLGTSGLTLGLCSVKDDEIKVNVTRETDEAIWVEFLVKVTVDDETKAKAGDVIVKVGGKSDTNASEAPIAIYGEYGAKIEAKGSAPQVVAGMLEQEITDIVIKEDTAGSLVKGRTIILTLPENAKWGAIDKGDSDNGCEITFAGFPGTDGRAAKWEVTSESPKDAATLELEDMEIVTEAGVEGDIEVKVSGTAGLSGTITVAKAIAPVKIEAAGKPEVRIGLAGQQGADLIITEVAAGAIEDFTGAKLIVDLPNGMSFDKVPKVEVTEGDLDIDESGVKRQKDDIDNNQLVIPIDRKSNTASTIKISDIVYTLDRNVPEGDVIVKVKGTAAVQVHDKDEITDYYSLTTPIDESELVKIEGKDAFRLDDYKIWPNSGTAAKTVGAVCVTPAPGEQKPAGKVVFTINDTKFKVGDTEQEMDVAPYIKDGRTFIPVRYAAQACGVTPENILYSDGKVTLIKGDKVVQLTIGSNVMLINGVAVNMDVAAELSNDRTMLPFRWVAQALGAKVSWDEATQTVTMEL